MSQQEGMDNYGADLTNARANAGAIVLYEHEERNLMKAMEGLQALRNARNAFLLVNGPDHFKHDGNGTVYDEGQIANMMNKVETQLILCRQRIQNMKESFNHLTGLTWEEKVEQGFVSARARAPIGWTREDEWTREEDEANGTILLTKATEV